MVYFAYLFINYSVTKAIKNYFNINYTNELLVYFFNVV